jgi:hypothetical protein
MIPSASTALSVVAAGGGGGGVTQGKMIPSPANVEVESTMVKTTDAKSCCSFFMVFPAKVKLHDRLKYL